jgi:hypothetical protein
MEASSWDALRKQVTPTPSESPLLYPRVAGPCWCCSCGSAAGLGACPPGIWGMLLPRSLLMRPANAGRKKKTTDFGLVFSLRLPISPAFLVIEFVL